MTTCTSTHAIVLGRGIAGLLAARALAERFDEITVIDRDPASPGGSGRSGTPQAQHAHALLAAGQQRLEDLFPGLTAELVAAGAPTGDLLGDTAMNLNGHRLASMPSGLVALSASRAMLERHVHRRVAAIPNIEFAAPADVVGLTRDARSERVTGVRVLRHADGSAAETLCADLVVDALGRTSRAPFWLEQIGLERPTDERIGVDLRYATRCFRARDGDLAGLVACIEGPWPGRPRGGVLARIEGGRWMLTLAGMVGEVPGRDRDGFAAFGRSLGSPEIDQILATGEPLDDGATFRFPASVRRRYEHLRSRPSGFLAIGDSLCSLNPVYGQGMSIAALQAHALLMGHRTTSEALWPAMIRPVEAAWTVVRATDLAFDDARGHRKLADSVASRYVERVHAAASTDADVSVAFVRVSGLVDPPSRLFAPRIVWRTLVGDLSAHRNRFGRLRVRGGMTSARLIASALVAPITATVAIAASSLLGRTAVRCAFPRR
jgi:2-polyprenyl-6-methoxyphenol hydroxylase-like FAD-dependent oxidoreductase